MPSYLDLTAQLVILDLKIEIAHDAEKTAAVREIQARMAEYGISPEELKHLLKDDGNRIAGRLAI